MARIIMTYARDALFMQKWMRYVKYQESITINKIRNDGQYSIGMFTKKDITIGEELCFDYCSVS